MLTTISCLIQEEVINIHRINSMDWLSLSRVAPMSYIRDHVDMPWSRDGLSRRRDITMDDIEYLDSHSDALTGSWCWRELSKWISIVSIRRNLDIPWNRRYLCRPGITMDDIAYLDDHSDALTGHWDWIWICRYMPMSDMMNHPHLPYCRYNLSDNKTITMEAIEYLDRYLPPIDDDLEQWGWYKIASLLSISHIIRYIKEGTYPLSMWSKNSISHNPGITMDIIRVIDIYDVDGSWDWEAISKVVPMNDILTYI